MTITASTGRSITITVDCHTVETVNGWTHEVPVASSTETLENLTPAEVVAYASGAYPAGVESITGGVRFRSEDRTVDYYTGARECVTVDVIGYSPITLATIGARIMPCHRCTLAGGEAHAGTCDVVAVRSAAGYVPGPRVERDGMAVECDGCSAGAGESCSWACLSNVSGEL
jgi:hypothetical protein